MVVRIDTPGAAVQTVEQLRHRMARMQDGTPSSMPLATHPALAGLVQLRAGASYSVDSATLALALLAGPSRAGGWCAAVGVSDFGAEAAVALGVDLDRTVLVPDPGEQWLEVTSALVDVATMVLVRPHGRIAPSAVEKLSARLRKRGAALVVWGEWPRCEVRLTASEPSWAGVGQGHGHLRARRLVVEARRGTAPPRRGALWFPAEDQSWVRDHRIEQAPVVEDVGVA